MNPSENSTLVDKLSGETFNATCIHCGETNKIQLWPHRNGHGNMIGFVFACDGCADVVRRVTLEIHGIRGHKCDIAPNPSLTVAAKHLLAVAEAHELSSCSCDRDGRFTCECFEDACAAVKKALAAEGAVGNE